MNRNGVMRMRRGVYFNEFSPSTFNENNFKNKHLITKNKRWIFYLHLYTDRDKEVIVRVTRIAILFVTASFEKHSRRGEVKRVEGEIDRLSNENLETAQCIKNRTLNIGSCKIESLITKCIRVFFISSQS